MKELSMKIKYVHNEKSTFDLSKMFKIMICLFHLILHVPSTLFQLCRDGSSWDESEQIRLD